MNDTLSRRVTRGAALSLFSALAAFALSPAHADVPLSGALTSGYWPDLLHLGETFTSDDFAHIGASDGLADHGGEANQNPYPGLSYSGLNTSASTATPGTLVWTPIHCEGGYWAPADHQAYTKYWHIYVKVPGTEPRNVRFYVRQDDDLYVWNNGTPVFASIGWDGGGEKGPFGATLAPGQNSITIKLDDGGGGNCMAIRVTDANGNAMSDLSYQLYPDLSLADPVFDILGFTSTNAAKVVFLPPSDSATEYQLSLSPDSADLDPAGWKAYAPGDQPADIVDFPRPVSTRAAVPVYAWFRASGDDSTLDSASGTIVYNVQPPVVAVRDATLPINPSAGRTILPGDIDAGSYDSAVGIRSMSVSPSVLRGSGTVTLTVVNNVGLSSSATANVTAVPVTGTLPQGLWTTMLHLGSNFDVDDLSNSGGIDGDQLANFGGQDAQRPYHGLVYDGLATALHGTGPLAWTATYKADGHWEPASRDYYIKYWHTYLNVPGTASRAVRFLFRHDDNVRAWNNGTLFYSANYTDANFHTVDTTLSPGLNSITFKLEEGGGGDYFEVAMTDPDGNYFDDITFQLDPTEFVIENPITASTEYLGTNAVRVARMPRDPAGTAFQFTLSGNASSLDPDNWIAYVPGMVPSDLFAFPAPAADGDITVHAWIRCTGENAVTNHYEGPSIHYTTVRPTVRVKDAALDVDPVNGTAVLPADVDDGTFDPVSGIYSLSVSPSVVYTPTNVILTAMNNAGLTASAETQVSPAFWASLDVVGADTAYNSLNAAFHAAAYGSTAATSTVFCAWDFGDGSAIVKGQDLLDATHLYTLPGAFTVSLTVTNLLGDAASTNIVRAIKILGDRFVADASAGPGAFPYTDASIASSDLATVIDTAKAASRAGAAGVTVEIAPGTYYLTTQIDLDEPIALVGTAGPDETLLVQTVDQLCVVTVTTNATVAGLALQGKYITNDNRVGGGIRMTSGFATNVVVTGCTGGGHAIGCMYGSAYLDGDALMVDSRVVNNRFWYNAAAVWIKGDAVMDRCEVAYNYGNAQHFSGDGGGGIRMESGNPVVRNCYIHHNESIYHYGGGVRIDSGVLENCTIVANQVGNADNPPGMGAGGVRHNGGTVRNCVIYGNHDFSGASTDYAGANTATYSCAPELVSGTGNTSLDPLFVEATNGNYRLSSSSPCVDTGAAPDAASTLDFALGARLVDGNGDGVATVDMGCYEYARDTSVFDCSFVVSGPSKSLGTLDTAFAATVYGSLASTSSVTCAWDFGDGTPAVVGHNLYEVEHEYEAMGLFTVTLAVTNSLGETAAFSRPDCITILSDHVFVSTNGASVFPFATPADATPDLGEAYKVIVQAFDCGATAGAIEIGPGGYVVSAEIALDRPITVTGAGRGLTHVYQATTDQRGFVLTDPSAVVSSLTVHGAYTPNNRWGGGICLSAGVATNVVVTDCAGGGHGIGGLVGAVFVNGTGLLVDSLVVSNRYDYNGAGVWIESDGALVDRCEIAWNRGSMEHHSGDGGGGVRMWGGTVRNCLIHHNTAIHHYGGGVRIYYGVLENCTIADNNVENNGLGIGGGVFHQGGTVRNCIIARNRAGTATADPVDEDYVMYYDQYVEGSCAPEMPDANGNITAAPRFKDAANCDYHLVQDSPTIGKGVHQAWMDGAFDLDHEFRVLGTHVDMGCYETRLPGTLLLLR